MDEIEQYSLYKCKEKFSYGGNDHFTFYPDDIYYIDRVTVGTVNVMGCINPTRITKDALHEYFYLHQTPFQGFDMIRILGEFAEGYHLTVGKSYSVHTAERSIRIKADNGRFSRIPINDKRIRRCLHTVKRYGI